MYFIFILIIKNNLFIAFIYFYNLINKYLENISNKNESFVFRSLTVWKEFNNQLT